jgi:Glycosyl hydrolases family 31/Domain of unknown function (DUF5110)
MCSGEAELSIRQAGAHSIEIRLTPLNMVPTDTLSAPLAGPFPALVIRELTAPIIRNLGALLVQVSPHPLRITVTTPEGLPVQKLTFPEDSTLSFMTGRAPLLGLGEGAHLPAPGKDWRQESIEFDRRGRLQEMQPRWQSDAYGSRNPVPLLIGTEGWALFIAAPWGQWDLRPANQGIFIPWRPTAADFEQQTEKNQQLAQFYYQGPLSTFPDIRPFSLHRNGYLGIARWGGWVWSGDTESSWKTLEGQIAVGINHSLSLSPYWGSDIGGFYSNSEKTGELYARWFQFGAFCPSFRSHGRTSMTILPWGWGQGDRGDLETPSHYSSDSERIKRNVLPSEMNDSRIEPIVKEYDELRYQLLPYTYTLAWEARQTGMPLMRALWLHYPDDTTARGMGSEYLWGRDLLIAPVFKKGAVDRDVYLPKGEWYDWWTLRRQTGGRNVRRKVDLSIMPIYVRAGAIIPFDPVRQYTDQPVTTPTTLRIYPGADGDFTLYEDDGISQDYLSGKATWIRVTWDDKTRTLSLRPGSPAGFSSQPVQQTFVVRLMTGGADRTVKYKGEPVSIRL